MEKSIIIEKFSDTIVSKYTSECTLKTYDSLAQRFIYDNHPDSINNLTSEYIKKYLINILNKKSISSYNQMLSVLKILYRDVFNQKYKINKIRPMRCSRKLKSLLSKRDISIALNNIKNLKHYTIIMTLLSTGVRISELLNIEINDVDSYKSRILIRNGKGQKSRFVSLNPKLLSQLRSYYKQYRPTNYLFEGVNNKYSKSSVSKFIKKYFGKECHAHLFRHLFISYMINKDVNIHRLKHMTGHKSDKTLEWYYQYTDNSIENTINPINELI